MKEFLVYTGMRILLFLACVLTVFFVWDLLGTVTQGSMLWIVVIGFAASGVLSYFLLNRQREAFARKVQERAERAGSAFEERRSREDTD